MERGRKHNTTAYICTVLGEGMGIRVERIGTTVFRKQSIYIFISSDVSLIVLLSAGKECVEGK